ncbi:MAG: mannose-1-phosphate guanylyltransferase, partial [Planctomycetaceae bacterium]|nr:mannose-1-phosphate guanylyltransferase [Planctomycetaceae bacterium]
MFHAVILAGGTGTRLWPESREKRAKQFLTFESGGTMIQNTVRRLEMLVPNENICVLTTAAMTEQMYENLLFLPKENIIAEPVPRNTAPCIGLAAIQLLHKDPEAVMCVLPSDHVIKPAETFCETLRFAADLCNEDESRLITIGIKPAFPAESYGYIQRDEKITSSAAERWKHLTAAYQAVKFHEKPKKEKAAEFLATGKFAWNAGIFIWKAATIYKLLCEHEPETGEQLNTIRQALGTSKQQEVIAECFPKMKKNSIDYAVLEKAENIVMLESVFSWDDVGTWCSLDRLNTERRDTDGNLAFGAQVLTVD